VGLLVVGCYRDRGLFRTNTVEVPGVGSRGEGWKTGGRAREVGIYFSSFQGIPVLSVNTEVIGLTEDLF